jgi:pyruvate/2-oxoglutarate dehydrogenase complex dihydrolipoamide dehydrogenase (E3) component
MADLLVIGSGPGGVAAAREARRRGASVTLVERAALGGTCTHAGCVPAGAFHRAATILDEIERAPALGISADVSGVEWARLQAWVGGVVGRAAGLARTTLESAGVEVVSAPARFEAPGRVEAGGRVLEAAAVVLATGAVSVAPPLPEPPPVPVLTNAEAMALDGPPASLLVADAARFGLEWADLFAHVGSRVTVATAADRLLPAEDADIAGFLQLLLERRGVRFLLGAAASEALAGVEADAVLFADTRVPATAGLRLESAGVATGPDGAVTVDAACRTTAPTVFAAGDVTGPPWLSNRARAQGLAAATNALGGSARVRPERVPRSVNTHPELAAVGLTEAEAGARGLSAAVGYGELATSLRGITLGEDEGALKLVVDPEYGEILGAHMVGVGAVEVIAQVVAAMELEADYRDLARVSHLHPSLAELVTEAIASI